MKKAIFAGSFDPITNGHLDILNQALKDFDEVTMLIGINPDKTSRFSLEDRLMMIKQAIKDNPKVKVDSNEGLTVDYAKKHDSKYLIRGIRNQTDVIFEEDLANANKVLDSSIETVLYQASEKYIEVSSTSIMKMIGNGEDISKLVPESVIKIIKQ